MNVIKLSEFCLQVVNSFNIHLFCCLILTNMLKNKYRIIFSMVVDVINFMVIVSNAMYFTTDAC